LVSNSLCVAGELCPTPIYRRRMDDIDKIAAQIEQHVKDMFPKGVNVPQGVSEDEAARAVQKQFTDAGFDCPDDTARDLVRKAWEQAQ
jgi:hypothetical protein